MIVVKTSGKKFLKVEVNKVIRFLRVIVKECTFLSFVSKKDSLVQPADIGLPTGNGKKLSCSQAQLGQATCLAVT